MQAEIEDTLRMLIDSLRRMIEDGDGQCGSCNGEPPLVPLSAELKMILALQKRVHGRTKTYDEKTPEAYGIDVAPRLEVLKTTEPAGRKAGVKVKTVGELVDKLKNEMGLI